MQQALLRVPVKERVVLVLHDVCGLSYSEIAPAVPDDDINVLLRKARETMVRVLNRRV